MGIPAVDFDWVHMIVGGISAVAGAAGGLVAGIWRIAHIEHDLRRDFEQEVAEATHELGEKLDNLSNQFDETLKGLRQKINDVELYTEREFMSKDGFDEFRREFREDMKSLNEKLDRMNTRR